MDKNAKTNRLSIYLIKKEFDSPATIFKDIDSLSAFNLDDSGTSILYTKDSYIHPPKWIENFFLKSAKDFKLKNSSFIITATFLKNSLAKFSLILP